jgi:hypothetical protein
MEGLQIWVRRRHQDRGNVIVYVAELAVTGHDDEQALIEARSPEELSKLLETAVPAFASCVRLRLQAPA